MTVSRYLLGKKIYAEFIPLFNDCQDILVSLMTIQLQLSLTLSFLFAMSKPPARNGAPQRRPGEEDGELHTQLQTLNLSSLASRNSANSLDICPVCKSSRYLNPNMRFLVNPECYHKMCESCVDRIFSQGPAPCPVAGCARTLRKQRFRRQTFEDLQIEREVDIRRRVAAM